MANVSQSAILMLAERLFRAFTGIFVSVAVARYLGPEGFGAFSYVTAVVGLFVVFGLFGTEHVLLKDWRIAGELDRAKAFTIALMLRMIGAIFSILVVFCFAFFSDDLYKKELILYSLILLAVVANIFEPLNMADELGVRISGSQLIVNLLSSMLKLSAVFTNQPLIVILLAYLLESVLQSIGQGIVHFTYLRRRHLANIRFDDFKKSLLRVVPLVLDGFVVMAYMKIDQLLIARMQGLEQLGQYSVAVRLVEFTYIVPVVLSGVFNTYIYKLVEGRSQRFKSVSILVTMFALVGAAITFTVGPLIVRFLYGGEYTLAGDVIRYYSLVIPVVFWGVLSSRWLIEQELQKLLLMRNLIGFTTNISLNLLLIPKFGLYGATIATICAQVASVCIATGLSRGGRLAMLQQLNALGICFRPFRMYREVIKLVKNV